MGKRKSDKILGKDIWEIEVAHWINERGLDPIDARAWTIIRWMYFGDLAPLSTAIKSDDALDRAVLTNLARLIDEGRIVGKRRTHFIPPPAPATKLPDVFMSMRSAKAKLPLKRLR